MSNKVRKPLIYGHRGACGLLPENTLEAFKLALESGADAIETDLRRTKDHRFVLAHDATGARMCGCDGVIGQETINSITKWDAGWGFVGTDGKRPFRGAGFKIPQLSEVLELFPTARFNIDIKDRIKEREMGSYLGGLIRVIREVGAQSRVLLTSFHSQNIRRLRTLGYEGHLGLGAVQILPLYLLPGWVLPGNGGLGDRVQVPMRQGPLHFAKRGFVDKCHSLGLAVDFWVINEPAIARYLVQIGADGIMSDFPGTILESLK